MANYINKVQIGTNTYDIGMKNAIHFHGMVFSSQFSNYSTGKDELTHTGSTMALKDGTTFDVEVGCMVLIDEGSSTTPKPTNYEYVCVEVTGTGATMSSKWNLMGRSK